jgi:exopolyphosphatase/guanosine-5'-triphosphate,3'-diphosphate pyrophosphatase
VGCFNQVVLTKAPRRAVIDVGTNSIKLLVAEVSEGVVCPVDERSDQTRLGAGLYETHELQPVPIARTASAVARFVAMARDQEAESVRIVATSAARDARNAGELVEAIHCAAGLRVEIISGEQEAEWVFRGVTSDPKLRGQALLILDVGGGSTEFIVGDEGHLLFRESYALGTVRLLEQLRPSDPPSLKDLADCRKWLLDFLKAQVGPAMETRFSATTRAGMTLVGTGGTTTILARMLRQLTSFKREEIEGTRLSRQHILEEMVRLWSLSLAARKSIPGLPPGRADVILMGVAIYEAVMQHLDLDELYVSTRGLRFGALLS